MIYRGRFLIKLKKVGINSSMFCWLKYFLHDRSIQVRTAQSVSGIFENGFFQESIVSPHSFLSLLLISLNIWRMEWGFLMMA